MRKQTQTRQYGYVSPKCRTIRLDAGFCFEGSYGEGGLKGYTIGDDDDDNHSTHWNF